MVDDHHVLAFFINLRSLDKVRGMYVDDDQQSVLLHILRRDLRLDERRLKALLQQVGVHLFDRCSGC